MQNFKEMLINMFQHSLTLLNDEVTKQKIIRTLLPQEKGLRCRVFVLGFQLLQ